MKRRVFPLLLLIFLLLLGGCGQAPAAPAETGTPATTPAAAPETPAPVDLGGTLADPEATELALGGKPYTYEALLAAAERLPALQVLDLGETELSVEKLKALREAWPQAELRCRFTLFGRSVGPETETLALPELLPSQTAELAAAVPLLPALREIDLMAEDGSCAFTAEDLPALDAVRAAAPQVKLRLAFELFGKLVSSEDERIEYLQADIGNEGLDVIRAALPYLSSCRYLLLDGCGIDNEPLAQLREDFPDTKVVWRVWLVTPRYNSPGLMRSSSFLTDTERVRTVNISDETSDVLRYCVDTKYVDFGHNRAISDFSFLACMPKLEACIIALTDVSDLTPLASCPELEYLEVYSSLVTDLSPLAKCTKLKHLNISRLEVTDISCLYGLELERLRCVMSAVPKEQLEEYARLHPDCQMLLDGWAPHENGWRFDSAGKAVPRYALLREQMEYDLDHAYGIP